MNKLMKTVAMILVLAMACTYVSATAEEIVQPPVSTEVSAAQESAPEAAPAEAPEAPTAPQAEAETQPAPTAETETAPVTTDVIAEAEDAVAQEIVPDALPNEEPATDTSNISITIRCLNGYTAQLGDTITLTADITGAKGATYSLQWQYRCEGGWQNVNGANGTSYRYTLNEDNARYDWRLILTVG